MKPPSSGPVLVAFVVGHAANIMDIAGSWEVFQETDALRERYYGDKAAAQTAHFMEYTRSPERPGNA